MRIFTLNQRAASRVIAVACACMLIAACGLFGGNGSLAAGQKDQAAGEYRAAFIQATKVLRHDKKDGEAWLLLGKASLMLGNPRDTLVDIEHAEANGVGKDRTMLTKADAMLVSGEFDKLVKTITTNPKLDAATNAQLDAIRGDAFRGLTQTAPAQAAYEAALKLDAGNARAQVGLARLEAAAGNAQQAESGIARLLKANPDDPRALVARADLAFDRNDFAAAEPDYQKATDSKDQDWIPQERFYARSRLADAQTRQNKLKQALVNIQALEKLAPEQPYPHYLHAEVLYKQGHLEDAISQLQLVMKGQPDNIPAQMLMGAIDLAQRNFGQAEMNFSNVIGVDTENLAARRLLALTYYRAGNNLLAVNTLRPTVTGNPSDATLLSMLQQAATSDAGKPGDGDVLNRQLALAGQALGSGNEAEAVRLLESAKVNGASAEAQRDSLLVMSYLREHRPDEALKAASAAVAKRPDSVATQLLYGTALVAAGRRDDARGAYLQALKLDPKNKAVLLSLGGLDHIDGRDKDAVARFKAVLVLEPNNVVAMTDLGKVALAQGDAKQALDWFKRAVGANPDADQPRIQLVAFYGGTGKFAQAVTTARIWAAAAPRNAVAQNTLGVAQMEAGQLADALKSLAQAVQLAPNVVAYQISLARAQEAAKDHKAAEATLAKVVAADPRQVQAVAMLAFIKVRNGDIKGALAEAKALQQQSGTIAQGYSLEGDIYVAAKEWDKAAPAYASGLKLSYNRTLVVKSFLSQVHNGAAHPEAVLDQWLAKHPEDVGSRLMLAQYYMDSSQGAQAATQYEAVLKAHPEDVTALNNLAWMYVASRNPKGLVLAEQAFKLAPASPNVQDTYGWALVTAGQAGKAVPVLLNAVKAAPKAPTLQYHLAVAQADAGDKTAALATLQDLRKVHGTYPDQKAAEALFRKLGGS